MHDRIFISPWWRVGILFAVNAPIKKNINDLNKQLLLKLK